MSRIFISYRRDDAAGYAGHLYSDLGSHFAGDKIFMDVDGIPYGEDFARYITRAVGQCDVLIALIGPAWLAAKDVEGRRRLDDDRDFVRLEITAALQRDIRVIPVLVQSARLPRPDELPEPLRPLVQRQALELENSSWAFGVGRLISALEDMLGDEGDQGPVLALSTDELDFGTVATQEPWPRRTVQLRNAGGGDLAGHASTDESWLVVRTRGDAVDVLVDTSYPGDYLGKVLVRSAGGDATIRVRSVVSEGAEARPARSTSSRSQPQAVQPATRTQQEPPRPVTQPVPAPAASPRPPSAPATPPSPAPPGARPQTLRQPGPSRDPGPGERRAVVGVDPQRTRTYLVESILATLLCCPPVGIVALVYATQVRTKQQAGDWSGAATASSTARRWLIVGAVAGVLMWAALAAGGSGY